MKEKKSKLNWELNRSFVTVIANEGKKKKEILDCRFLKDDKKEDNQRGKT